MNLRISLSRYTVSQTSAAAPARSTRLMYGALYIYKLLYISRSGVDPTWSDRAGIAAPRSDHTAGGRSSQAPTWLDTGDTVKGATMRRSRRDPRRSITQSRAGAARRIAAGGRSTQDDRQ